MITGRKRHVGATLLGLVMTMTLRPGPASAAAGDTSPPRLTIPALAQFVQGASLGGQFQIEGYTFDYAIPMSPPDHIRRH